MEIQALGGGGGQVGKVGPPSSLLYGRPYCQLTAFGADAETDTCLEKNETRIPDGTCKKMLLADPVRASRLVIAFYCCSWMTIICDETHGGLIVTSSSTSPPRAESNDPPTPGAREE